MSGGNNLLAAASRRQKFDVAGDDFSGLMRGQDSPALHLHDFVAKATCERGARLARRQSEQAHLHIAANRDRLDRVCASGEPVPARN